MSGHNSVVEYKLPKLGVASSNLVARSIKSRLLMIKVAKCRFWQCRCDLDLIFLSWVIK
jgi:hypothetical protein